MRNRTTALGAHGLVGACFVAMATIAGCSSAGGGGSSGSSGDAGTQPSDAEAPTIVTQPKDTEVSVGATATFTVAVTGGTAPVTYQWKRNGVAVAGATEASITTSPAVMGDDGASYSVDVVNPAGTLPSSAALLTVTPAKAWGTPTLINSGDPVSSPGNPDVAIDSAGNAIAVWREQLGSTRNGAWASRYVAGGAWSPAATIDNTTGNSTPPRVAITASGAAVATFTQSALNNGGVVQLFASRFESAWEMPKSLGASDQSPPSDQHISLGNDGAAVVTFLQADAVQPRVWITSSTPGSAWAAPAFVDTAGGALPEVALAANGHAVVTWVESQGPSTAALWASRNVGAGWSAPVRVTKDTGLASHSVRVVMDGSGNATAVWSQVIASRTTVRAARLDDATGTWGAPIALSDGMKDASGEDVAGDSKGNAVVVSYATNGSVKANRFDAAKGTWSGAADVTPVLPQAFSAQPRVALDGNGNAVAVWLEIPSGKATKRVFAAHSTSTGWGTPVSMMTDPNASTSEAAVVAVNIKGEATVVWQQSTDTPVATGIWARVYR